MRVVVVAPVPIAAEVTLLGTVAAGRTAAVTAPFDGVVRERRVDLRTRVHAGEVLAEMEAGEIETRFREAQSALLKASMVLDGLERWDTSPDVLRARRTLEAAEATLANAERQATEVKALFDRGIVSRNEYDGLVQQREAQRVTVAGARQDLQTAQERGSANNRRLAELDLANAKARLAELRQQMEGTTIRAPTAGILIRPPVNLQLGQAGQVVVDPGARLSRGQPIFAIADTDTLVVAGKVDEVDVNQIRIGQEVAISSDAFPGVALAGRVTAVSAEANGKPAEAGQAPSFEVRAAFAGPDDATRGLIRLGMSARMAIAIRAEAEAIVIPIEAVRDAPRRPTVILRDPTSGDFAPRRVILGTTNEKGIEIRVGLAAGDVVRLP